MIVMAKKKTAVKTVQLTSPNGVKVTVSEEYGKKLTSKGYKSVGSTGSRRTAKTTESAE